MGTMWRGAVSPSAYYNAVFITCYYPTMYLAMVYLIGRLCLHRRPSRMIGHGPIVTLLVGVLFVTTTMLLSMILQADFGRRSSSFETSWLTQFNWYWIFGNYTRTGSISFDWWSLFFLPTCPVVLVAIIVAGKELLQAPLSVPERVIEDSQPVEPQLPPGESIDEIFA